MKKIYLKDRNSNWKEFSYEQLSELADELKKMDIKIEAGVTIIKEVEDTYATEILNELFSNFNNTFSNLN